MFTTNIALNSWVYMIKNGTTNVQDYNNMYPRPDILYTLLLGYRVNRVVGIGYKFQFRQDGAGSGSDLRVGFTMNPLIPYAAGKTYEELVFIEQAPFTKLALIPASPQGVALGHTFEGAIDMKRLVIGPDIEYSTDNAWHSINAYDSAGVFSHTEPSKLIYLTPYMIPDVSSYDGNIVCNWEMSFVVECDDLLLSEIMSNTWANKP